MPSRDVKRRELQHHSNRSITTKKVCGDLLEPDFHMKFSKCHLIVHNNITEQHQRTFGEVVANILLKSIMIKFDLFE